MLTVLHDPKILWHLHEGDGPLLGLAVHAGHEIRPELLSWLAIDEATRFREEDPYTDYWTMAFDTQLLTRRSRFEVDLNRRIDHAVCIQPEDCWNLHVWKQDVPAALLKQGDVVSIHPTSRQLTYFGQVGETLGEHPVPGWLAFDSIDMTGRVLNYPAREEIDLSVNEQLVVEYYSR